MPLRVLPDHVINRIAAGEVIERPASAVKELVENAIDAGATDIRVTIRGAGRNLIRIDDNGKGMNKAELALCLLRHATSKLDDDDLWNVRFLGFRGEALASVASISRMSVVSRAKDADAAHEIRAEGGAVAGILPAARRERGTCVEIRDLFFATPARLKFLKHDRTEITHVQENILRQALANPGISFSLVGENDKPIYALDARGDTEEERLFHRVASAMEPSFAENGVAVAASDDAGYSARGYAGLPTLHRGNSHHMYLFVNGRPVRDKILTASVRAAYQDYLPRMRYPILALYASVPPEDVDVNVHPAKTEVRFRHESKVRGVIVRALHEGLRTGAQRSSTEIAAKTLEKARVPSYAPSPSSSAQIFSLPPKTAPQTLNEPSRPTFRPLPSPSAAKITAQRDAHRPEAPRDAAVAASASRHNAYSAPPPSERIARADERLGAARCQLHDNYIVAQTDDAVVIVDQHAAHERLRYEKMKREYYAGGVRTQQLLIPEIVELEATDAAALEPSHYDALKRFGFHAAPFGENAVIVRATPAILGNMDAAGALRAVIDDVRGLEGDLSMKETVEEVMATMACKGAIKSGRRLSTEEMDALLREMEATPFSGQCNHGRPTYVELKLKDIEKLFGRT
ncbi:MAG: DNA mismatch repair endonuclease MutL [Rickettsiales bacterium]